MRARQLKDMQSKLASQGEHAVPAAVQRMHARISKTIAVELVKIEAEINGLDFRPRRHFARTRRDHRKRSGTRPHHLCLR